MLSPNRLSKPIPRRAWVISRNSQLGRGVLCPNARVRGRDKPQNNLAHKRVSLLDKTKATFSVVNAINIKESQGEVGCRLVTWKERVVGSGIRGGG